MTYNQIVEEMLLTDEEIDVKYVEAWGKRNIGVDSPLKLKLEDGEEEIDVLGELCQTQLNKILSLGYKSPKEVEEAVRKDRIKMGQWLKEHRMLTLENPPYKGEYNFFLAPWEFEGLFRGQSFEESLREKAQTFKRRKGDKNE